MHVGETGGYASEGQIVIRSDGVLLGEGRLLGDVVNLGLLSPGLSAGTMEILGDYAHSGGLMIEVFFADEYDRLVVDGEAALGGTLEVAIGQDAWFRKLL